MSEQANPLRYLTDKEVNLIYKHSLGVNRAINKILEGADLAQYEGTMLAVLNDYISDAEENLEKMKKILQIID